MVTKAVKSNVKDELKGEFRYLIATHVSYSSPLITYEHQFTFGGNELHNAVTGFLVPHSGRIRKIKMKTRINKESLEDRLVERDRVDVSFAYYGFFSFIRIRDGKYRVIGTIRCQKVIKYIFKE